jgi:anti-sigma factor RsiW
MKKACKEYAEKLSALVDGEISGDGAEAVRAHVASCEACRAALVEMEKLRKLVNVLDPPEPDENKWDSAWGAVNAAIDRREKVIRTWRAAVPLAAAAAIIIALVLIFAPPGGPGAGDVTREKPVAAHDANPLDPADGLDITIDEVGEGYRAFIVYGDGPNTIELVCLDKD